MRRVSIGCGAADPLIDILEGLAADLRAGNDAEISIQGNGSATPDLELSFVNEGDPEWEHPLVDYSGE